tara:strand:- start:328 stop:666 length:339 start_codon:yes stop_codon:yes gene_type:complete
MEHQDWNAVIFNTPSKNKKVEESKKVNSNRVNNNPEEVRMEAPKQLGQLISQARTTKSKNQKILAGELGISQQILSRWESNKEVPTNAQIANIEKKLGVKLPRSKKVTAKDI